jgi:Na+-transporting methylmalonyl-CoA/oxaloacetate decarboxylase gamma subunit
MPNRERVTHRGSATFDWDTMRDGLQVSLVGMSIVSVVLVLLAGSIKALERLDVVLPVDRPAADTPPRSAAPARRPQPAAAAPARDDADARAAAVIGLALALAESESSRRVPTRPARAVSTGAWLQSGRARTMQSAGQARSRGWGK